jgi:hypothetical protein
MLTWKPPMPDLLHRLLLNRFIAIFLGIVMAGCASLSEDQCRKGGWQHLGEVDGSVGYPLERITAHREACAEYGIQPNDAEYRFGHEAGLRSYCTLPNALKEGLSGRSYQGVCTGPMGHRFAEIHAAAYSVHRARSEVDSIRDEIHRTEREIRSEKTPAERKKSLQEDLRHLERKLQRVRDDQRSRELHLDLATRLITQ